MDLQLIESKIQEIEMISRHEVKLLRVLSTFHQIFGLTKTTLLRYSHLGYIGEGLFTIEGEEYLPASSLKEDLRSLPIIYAAIQEKGSKLFMGNDIFLHQPSIKITSNFNCILVVPIILNDLVIGYFTSTGRIEECKLTPDKLQFANYFGRKIGHIFTTNPLTPIQSPLSNRELEVVARLSLGENTLEIAHSLKISEHTVKQYVKNCLSKLKCRNRTEAVAISIRSGWI